MASPALITDSRRLWCFIQEKTGPKKRREEEESGTSSAEAVVQLGERSVKLSALTCVCETGPSYGFCGNCTFEFSAFCVVTFPTTTLH